MNGIKSTSEIRALLATGRSHIERDGFEIELQLNERRDRLFFMTSVFDGGDYIPLSVRQCLKEGALTSFDRTGRITLKIDESGYRVLLSYEVQFTSDGVSSLDSLLNEFLLVASDWSSLLNDRGNRDLVYIFAPRN